MRKPLTPVLRLAVLAGLSLFLLPAGAVHAAARHSADTNGDNAVSLSELLRVIQVYNSAGYHCADPPGSTEDGYVPGANAGAQGCAPHDSDYNPQDWAVVLSELLRLIQFYNSGGYHALCGTEDNFAPGTTAPQPCDPEGEGEGTPEGEGEGAPEGEGEGEGAPTQFTLGYFVPLEGGSLGGATSQTVAQGGTGTPVEALPFSGYIVVDPDAPFCVGVPDELCLQLGYVEFVFTGWSDGRTDNPRTDSNVQGNVSVVAQFQELVTLQYRTPFGGSIDGPSLQVLQPGEDGQPVTAVPAPGFAFVRWSDGVESNPRADLNATVSRWVLAEFMRQYRFQYAAGPNGSLSGNPDQLVLETGNGTPVTAIPFVGNTCVQVDFDPCGIIEFRRYAFTEWSDGRTDNPRTDTFATADVNVTASFARQFRLQYSAGANGSLSGDPDQLVVQGSDGAAVTAVPDPGYAFEQWLDGSTENPRTDLDVQADLATTAVFSPIAYTLIYAAGSGGGLLGNLNQTVSPGESGTAVQAVPDAFNYFVGWSDGRTDNPRVDSGVQADVFVTAIFDTQLLALLGVPASTFPLGNPLGSFADEIPVHDVSLSPFSIGQYEVTNAQFAEMLNWARHPSRNYLRTELGAVWTGTGPVHGGESLALLIDPFNADGNLVWFTAGELAYFAPRVRTDGFGFPVWDMADHPVTHVTWHGAALFANWLSEREGYTPVYNTLDWTGNLANNGYRLPTEAQWERAAAWDGAKHWLYGGTSDTLFGKNEANYFDEAPESVNPLGILGGALTSPVGWFNGVNVSPNGSVNTLNRPSPIGAYDMSGNVAEWCHDWYSDTQYAAQAGPPAPVDPAGPASGTHRIVRGGGWRSVATACRSAFRGFVLPQTASDNVGFRLAR